MSLAPEQTPDRQRIVGDALADMIAASLPPHVRHHVTGATGRQVLARIRAMGWRVEGAASTRVDTDRLAALLAQLDPGTRATLAADKAAAYDRLLAIITEQRTVP